MAFKQVRLGDYFKFEKGLGYKGEFLAEESDVALIGMDSHDEGGGYKDGSEKPYSGPYKNINIASPGDVIFAATDLTQDGRVLGSPLLVPESDEFQTYIYSHHLLKAFQKKEGFLPEYLYNIFRTEKYRLKVAYADSGTTVRALPAEVLDEQMVPLPDLQTQQAINEIISLIDQQIANNKALSRNLEALAQSLFKSWFIDFDPVHAKKNGEKPFGMDAETAKLFPDSFVKSELGDIPNGWKMSKLGDLVDLSWGDTKTTKASYVQKGFIAYSASGPDGYLSKFDYDQVGIVLSAIGANCGATWLATGKWSCIKNTIRLIEKDSKTRYIPYVFQLTNNKEFWPKRGSAQPFIGQEETRGIEVLDPRDELVAKYADMTNSLFLSITNLHLENIYLKELQNTIIPNFIGGILEPPSEMIAS
jgi:type I restriction enzyme S subunit